MPPPPRRRSDDGRLRRLWAAAVPDHVIGLAWSPDGRFLAAAAVSGPVHVFAADGQPVAALAGHGFGTTAVAWAPAGDRLVTAGQDGAVRVWDPVLWQERAALDGGAAWVEHLAFTADGGLLATGAGKKVRVWDAAGTLLREWAGQKATVSDLQWRPGTRQLTVAAYGGVTVLDPAADDPLLQFPWKGSPLRLAWSPNGRTLAHGNQDASVHFWSFDNPKEPLQMTGFLGKVRELAWDYSSRFLATGGGEAVCVWDCGGAGPEGSKPQLLKGHAGPPTALAYQRRGFLLASGGPEGRAFLWQPANRKGPLVGEDPGGAAVSAVAWSADDKLLAVGAADGGVRVCRVT